ncbi:MAG: pilus assembly protein PilA [Sorangium cellulosum]|nr:MAG: pilus assembly protein PilA [Sorangium cellulosum]
MVTHSPTQNASANAAARRRARGFTLTEMMAVVVIIGVLAVLAVVGYRKYLNSAKSSEAVWMVNGIRSAQEAYRSETLSYLNVSGTLDTYYPSANPTNQKVMWGGGSSPQAKNWRILNVATDGAVYYGYATISGGPGQVVAPGLEYNQTNVQLPVAVEPWYMVQARGDINGDGIPSIYLASSFSNEVYWQNEGE